MIENDNMGQYHQRIQQQINALNSLRGSEVQQKTPHILRQLKSIDVEFMEQAGLQCTGQILFTRHGKCHIWYQKRFGLNPNSPLAQDAIEAMSITNRLTKQLLFFPQQPFQAWVSPMVRAKQTAMLILPESVKANIQYDISLSENSNKPSSSFITSNDQLRREYEASSISDSLKRVITYKLSNFFYGEERTFSRIKELSQEADRDLVAKSDKQISFLHKNPQAQRQKQIREYTSEIKLQILQKIITSSISNGQRKDLWFVGHSKNLKKFFKTVLDNKLPLEFGETRRVYYVKQNKNKTRHYFNPPYYLIINQEDGSIRAKYSLDTMRMEKIIKQDLELKTNQQK